MATRDELYAKFGITAEAAQLFETELGTLLLFAKGMKGGWHLTPDPDAGRKLLAEIDSHTLGRLLGRVRGEIEFADELEAELLSALKARNLLNHGFYERHNFKIQTDEGRALMVDDLENLHTELFQIWRKLSAITAACMKVMTDQL